MAQPMDTIPTPPPPTLANPRFTLELEFVLSLANPHYLSHLAITYPNLLGTTTTTSNDDNSKSGNNDKNPSTTTSSEPRAFAAYLAYLYSYWKTPEYAQFLTHPGATLRALRLLQEETFRKDVIRPQVIEGLLGAGVGGDENGAGAGIAGEGANGEAKAEGEKDQKMEG
jgi:mediator of RNA polymerase II transcription subunit 31